MNKRDEQSCRMLAASSVVGIPIREALAELDALRKAVAPFAKAFEREKYGAGVTLLQWRDLHRAACLQSEPADERPAQGRDS